MTVENWASARVGEVVVARGGGIAEIIEYKSSKDVLVMFKDTGFTLNTNYKQFKKGGMVDRLTPTVYGFGIIGNCTITENGKLNRVYEVWKNMIMRCYCEKKKGLKRYSDVTVSEEFRRLSDFKVWCEEQVGFNNEGWQLDKDILVRGNKVYSKNACCFVPPEINYLVCDHNGRGTRGLPVGVDSCGGKYVARIRVGSGETKRIGGFSTPDDAHKAYKYHKEQHIKHITTLWRGSLSKDVYDALMSWEV